MNQKADAIAKSNLHQPSRSMTQFFNCRATQLVKFPIQLRPSIFQAQRLKFSSNKQSFLMTLAPLMSPLAPRTMVVRLQFLGFNSSRTFVPGSFVN